MAFFKFVLVLVLCVPTVYLSMYFVDRLIDELQNQNTYKERLKRPARKRSGYNFKYEGRIDSKRNRKEMKNSDRQSVKKKERF